MEKLTIQELKEKMEKLGLYKCDYVLHNITLDEARDVDIELATDDDFQSVRLWGYPKDSNVGTYGWTVEV